MGDRPAAEITTEKNRAMLPVLSERGARPPTVNQHRDTPAEVEAVARTLAAGLHRTALLRPGPDAVR
ncbi:MAG TPA: hypothetical protein VFN48_02460 [Solirubrobacteraceae bacterium]|nr:hypothetical protein [Solirubrobacteraceae bacterium]